MLEKRTASDAVAEVLADAGVRIVFEVAGGMIAPLLDSFGRHPDFRVVTVHHEQTGAFAAQGYAQYSGVPAVAIGTAGPGALNLATGIASCYYDSVPAIFLAGHVQTYLQRGDRHVRQFGLQETCFADVARPIAKAVFTPRSAADLQRDMCRAIEMALADRPGPVVIEIPYDVQAAAAVEQVDRPVARARGESAEAVERILEFLNAGARPLVHVGGGVRAAGVAEELCRFVQAAGVPITTSILGKDVLASDDPLHAGMPGTYGIRSANQTMTESDAILVLGSRLCQGQIGADPNGWARKRSVLQVDCDAAELCSRVRSAQGIKADLRDVLPALADAAASREHAEWDQWRDRVAQLRREHDDTTELEGCPGINPNALMRSLSQRSTDAAAFVVDAGQHTWWAAQSIRLAQGQRFLASTGLWSMGVALGSAIGAALASGRAAVAVLGDGAMQMNLQELQTIVRNGLPIKLVVVNNGCLGMVRQFQDATLAGRHYSTVIGYDAPDFVDVARAYGIPAVSVSDPDGLAEALDFLWQDGPRLIEARIASDLPVMPQVPFGRALSSMDRYVPAAQLEAAEL